MSYSNITYSQTKIDTSTASQYFTKGKELLNKRKTDSSLTYFEKALLIYETIGDQKKIIDCYDKISQNQQNNFDYDSALVTAKKGLMLRQELFEKEHPQIALSHTQIGHIHKDKDQYQKAMDFYQKALKIQTKAFGNKDHRTADSYHHIGTIHHVLAQYDRALIYYQKSLEIRTKHFGKQHEKIAESYIDIGITHYHLGKDRQALAYYNKALKIRESKFGKHSPEVAFCYNHIGDILIPLDKFDDALEYQKKALSIMINTFGSDHPNTALCYYSIGFIHRRKGQHDVALGYYKKVLIILIQKIGNKNSIVGNTYNEIGTIKGEKNLHDQALLYFKKTYEIHTKIYPKKHSYIGTSFSSIGITYQYKGEHNKAITYFKKAIINFTNSLGKNHTVIARMYNNIANNYKAKEEYDLALIYYKKALKIRISLKGEDHSDTSYTYKDIGDIFRIQKEYDIALKYYEKTLQIHENLFGKTNYYISDINNAIANIYSDKKEYQKALEYLQKSIKVRLLTDGKHHPRTAKSYNQLAEVYAKLNEHKKAILYYDLAVTANKNPSLSRGLEFKSYHYLDLITLLQTLQGKAKTLQDFYIEDKNLFHLTKSINTYKKADILIDNIRQTLKQHEDKITFAKQAKTLYTDAILTQLFLYQINKKKQSLEHAFYYTERSRANILKGLLSESNARNFNGVSTAILDLEQDLKTKIAFYTSKITNEKSSKTIDTNKIVSYENELFDLAVREDSLLKIIEKKHPKYHQLKHQTQPITVIDIQKKLDNNTTILEFFLTDTTCYAFLISKNNLSVKELPIQELESQIEKFRNAIITKNTNGFKKNAFSLYNSLLNPIKDQIKGEQLIIIPDGPLWHLNFELLLTHTSVTNNPKNLPYLLKDYVVSYANSANLLLNAQHSSNETNKRQECLAFSFSDTTSLKTTEKISMTRLRSISYDLPGTREEIKAISDIIDGQYYFGSQAVERNFKKNANQYNILHLALHGDVDNDNPENSKLYFTKTKDSLEDNLLYSHELFALNIPADLTVLSACNTGTGKIAKGEGIMSLGNAFQYAGSKSLLLSSWEISDQTTPELMRFFYSNLKKGMNKPKALQQAKLQYLNTANINRVDPFYWGAFYLVGDIDPIQFNDNHLRYWIIGLVIIGILLLLGILAYKHKLKQQ
ncbi:tetratricopeptide repeat protein [Aquimarina sp. AD10]|uniref:tetratricopeptide repeat protein n=1 Tax=Aquimarina sp. AD10 TaxID=1714849 RepID=UPI0013149F47|nr:tetratricopeptide repeat protein [Aquimarina sp. AD10]